MEKSAPIDRKSQHLLPRRSSLASSFKGLLAPLRGSSNQNTSPAPNKSAIQIDLMKELDSVEALMKDMTEVSKTIVDSHHRNFKLNPLERRRKTTSVAGHGTGHGVSSANISLTQSVSEDSELAERRHTDSTLFSGRQRRKSILFDQDIRNVVKMDILSEANQRQRSQALELEAAAEVMRKPPLHKRVALKIRSTLGATDLGLEGMYKPYQLIEAASAGKTRTARLCLLSGLPINYQDPSTGMSPLCFAAAFGHLQTAQMLLDFAQTEDDAKRGRAVDPMVKSWDNGWNAVHYAARNGHVDILTAVFAEVRAAPIDVDAVDDTGCTALALAAHHGHEDCVRFLLNGSAILQHRAKVDTRDVSGMTPLSHAAWQGKPRCCRLLLKAGANKDKKAAMSNTIVPVEPNLKIRAYSCHSSSSSINLYGLSNTHCFFFRKDKSGLTAGDWAKQSGSDSCFVLIECWGQKERMEARKAKLAKKRQWKVREKGKRGGDIVNKAQTTLDEDQGDPDHERCMGTSF